MKDLIIVGAGGFGRELLQWVKDINSVTPTWNVLGFIDDNPEALKGYECDYKVIGGISGCVPHDDVRYAMAVANPGTKERISQEMRLRGAQFASIIHPTALISNYARIGEALVMYPNSVVTVNVAIGDFVTILSSGVGHDATIGDYCTISSYCDVTGGVTLGRRVFMGSHVTITPGRRVGDDAFVAAGSVVMTNVRAGYRVYGNPAHKMDF